MLSPNETGWRIGGNKAWLHVAATREDSYSMIADADDLHAQRTESLRHHRLGIADDPHACAAGDMRSSQCGEWTWDPEYIERHLAAEASASVKR